MGIIICNKHGKKGIKINIDKKIIDNIHSGVNIKEEDLVIVTVELFDELDFLLEYKILFRKDTFVENKLKYFYKISNELEEEEELLPVEGLLSGVCGECYFEYMKNNNININF